MNTLCQACCYNLLWYTSHTSPTQVTFAWPCLFTSLLYLCYSGLISWSPCLPDRCWKQLHNQVIGTYDMYYSSSGYFWSLRKERGGGGGRGGEERLHCQMEKKGLPLGWSRTLLESRSWSSWKLQHLQFSLIFHFPFIINDFWAQQTSYQNHDWHYTQYETHNRWFWSKLTSLPAEKPWRVHKIVFVLFWHCTYLMADRIIIKLPHVDDLTFEG